MSDFVRFTAEPAPQGFGPEVGDTRIIASTTTPIGYNAHIRAWVGDQELEGVAVDQFGLGFEAYMAGPPADTDTLSVQIDGGDKIDTGLTVDDEPPIS